MRAWVLFQKVSSVRGSKAVAPHKSHTTAARSPRRVSGDTLNTDTGIDTRNPTHHETLKSHSFLRIHKKGKVEADHSIQLMWWEAQWNFKTVFAAKRKKKNPRLAEAPSTLSKVLHVFRSSQTVSQTHEVSALPGPETCNQGSRATFTFGWRRANHLCRLVHLSWIRSHLCLVFCLLQCPHGVTGHPRANKGKYGKYWQEKNPVTTTTEKTGIYLLHHRMSRLP